MLTWLLFVSLLPDNGPSDRKPANDPRTRRAMREKAVEKVGSKARDLVEAYGEPAVAALFACQISTGEKLAALYNSGEMKKWQRPADLLAVIAKPDHRDEVALWAVTNHKELEDGDAFDAYLRDPLVICLRLKPLKEAAAELRASRMASLREDVQPPYSRSRGKQNVPPLIIAAGIIAVVIIVIARRGDPAKRIAVTSSPNPQR